MFNVVHLWQENENMMREKWFKDRKSPPGVMFQVKSDYPACFWRGMEGGGLLWQRMDGSNITREKTWEDEWSRGEVESFLQQQPEVRRRWPSFHLSQQQRPPQMRSVSSHTHTHTQASRSFSDCGGREGGIRNHRGAFKRDLKSQ